MSIAQIMTKSPFMFKIEHIVFLIMVSLAAFVISKFAHKSSILDIYIVLRFFFFYFPLCATFLMTINYGC